MAFETQGQIFKKQLEKMGATVRYSNRDHNLVVNEKYEICYTNYYFRKYGEEATIGQGKDKFMKMIRNESQ